MLHIFLKCTIASHEILCIKNNKSLWYGRRTNLVRFCNEIFSKLRILSEKDCKIYLYSNLPLFSIFYRTRDKELKRKKNLVEFRFKTQRWIYTSKANYSISLIITLINYQLLMYNRNRNFNYFDSYICTIFYYLTKLKTVQYSFYKLIHNNWLNCTKYGDAFIPHTLGHFTSSSSTRRFSVCYKIYIQIYNSLIFGSIKPRCKIQLLRKLVWTRKRPKGSAATR